MPTKLMEIKAVTSTRAKRPKLSFDELLAKYKKISKANVANRSRKVQLSRLLPKPQEWNW